MVRKRVSGVFRNAPFWPRNQAHTLSFRGKLFTLMVWFDPKPIDPKPIWEQKNW
jgi:hypothetical protein